MRTSPVLLVLATVLVGCSRTLSEVFRTAVAMPVPMSAVILDAQDGSGLSPVSWVHFRATPDDMMALLSANPYSEEPRYSLDFSSLHPPTWWKPASLGPGLRQYHWNKRVSDDVMDWRIICLNAAKDEAYAVYSTNW